MEPDSKEIASTVMNDLESYKLCAVCGSIVDKSLSICPDCFAYRFDTDLGHVSDAALDLATKPRRTVSHLDRFMED